MVKENAIHRVWQERKKKTNYTVDNFYKHFDRMNEHTITPSGKISTEWAHQVRMLKENTIHDA